MRRLTLLALALVVAAPANATPPGGNGKIAFVADAPGSSDAHVWTIDPDGGNLTDLTPLLRSFPWSVAWSPDGTEIAYTRPRASQPNGEFPLAWSVNLMDADGGNQRQIATFDGLFPTVTWSPDGERIAFPGLDADSVEIFSVRADGTDLVQHTSFRFTLIFAPSWSPDGTRFAFNADFTPATDDRIPLWTIAVDGTDRRRLSTRSAFGAEWSPDGTRVLSAFPDGLRSVAADGSGSAFLRDLELEWLPGWSPDGTRVVLASEPLDGGFEPYTSLVTMNADGTCPGTVLAAAIHSPSWQPIPGGPATPEERCADLALSTAGEVDHARTGRAFTLRAFVENVGNEPAPDVVLTHPLPARWAAEAAVPTQGASAGARPVVCELGTLAPGEQAEVVLTVRAASSASSSPPRASVSTSADDPVGLNDRAGVPFVRICDRLGTERADRLVGTPGRDVICALEGDDVILGRGGADLIFAGPGADLVRGGDGPDTLYGLGGADRILGGDGDDWIEPGWGRDRVFGGRGNDMFFTWDRYRDLVDGGPGKDTSEFHDSLDVLRSIERGAELFPRQPGTIRLRSLADAARLAPAERVRLTRAVALSAWGR